jgi:hypothetical protein
LKQLAYPFRLLDLARYPDGYRVNWRWYNSAPTGTIASSDWILDLTQITGVYVRFLGPEGRIPMRALDGEDGAAVQAESDAE